MREIGREKQGKGWPAKTPKTETRPSARKMVGVGEGSGA